MPKKQSTEIQSGTPSLVTVAAAMAQTFLTLTGPDGQVIQINQHDIVSMRTPRRVEHFAPGVHCVVFTSDGKYALVVEECAAVIGKMHLGEH